MHLSTLALLASGGTAFAATAAEWRSRAIYQVLTDRFARTDGNTTAVCDTGDRVYCGGTWQGIINQLDYIQGMGFDAIWISPVTYQLQGQTGDGSSYHGYWQQDLYSVNDDFGTAADLKNLSAAIHARDMYLMVDVVTNHNGWSGEPDSVNHTVFKPFDNETMYHDYCVIDYDDEDTITQCWEGDTIVPLVDLMTENPTVIAGYQTWIEQLVSNYSIDGIRMDSARQVNTAFWSPFLESADVFVTGEVFDGDPDYVCGFQDYLPSVLNYPMYYQAIAAFSSTSGTMQGLVNGMYSMRSACNDVTVLGSFTENHDNPRFAQMTPDMSLAKNVIAWTILSDGVPIIYEGQEQHYESLGGVGDPYNREAIWLSDYNTDAELYEHIASLNAIRRLAISTDSRYTTYNNYPIYSDASTIAMRKGYDGAQIIAVLNNDGEDASSYTLMVPNVGCTSCTFVDVLSCGTVSTDKRGSILVPMAGGLPRIYFPQLALRDSGICGL